MAAASLLAPALKVIALLMVLVALFNKVAPAKVTPPDERWLLIAPPEATDNVIPVAVTPPVKVLAPDNTMPPLLVALPKLSVPVPDPEIIPLKVTVSPVPAAIALAPVLKVMALLIVTVLAGLTNKEPPPRVKAPDERWLLLAPPDATDKIPPLMVVAPLNLLAPLNTTVPALPAVGLIFNTLSQTQLAASVVEIMVPLIVKVLPVFTLKPVPPACVRVKKLALMVESCVTVMSRSRFHEPHCDVTVPPQPNVPPASTMLPAFKW